jgi:flagellar hook assembly protein FlgD
MNRVLNWLSDDPTGIDPTKFEVVDNISLHQNFPNPFNPQTTISFSIQKSEKVSVRIFNNLGQIVKIFPEQKYETGLHKIIWNGNNQENATCSSGIYYYHVTIGKQQLINKMILLK